MSTAVFLGIAAACFAAGFLFQRPRYAWVALVLWVAGLAIAAAAGAFHATSEDNSLGMFFFTGLPTILWLLAFLLGIASGVVLRSRTAEKQR